MKIEQQQTAEARIIKPVGRLDSDTAPELEQALACHLEKGTFVLILDMTEIDYISSAGLRVILKSAKHSQKKALAFRACNLQDHVREIFEISGFDLFIPIFPSLQQALAAAQQADQP